MRIFTSLAALVAVAALGSAAHADDLGPYFAVEAAGLTGGLVAPVVFGAIDLAADPRSPTYGGVELAVGGTTATLNTVVAFEMAARDSSNHISGNGWAAIAVVATADLAVAAHGVYLLAHKDDLELRYGTAHGIVAPTMVSDGKQAAAGLGIVGRF